ncbi:MAG TPA: endolytic transglycosylase MltG [Gemmatimonadaceae bacterium]
MNRRLASLALALTLGACGKPATGVARVTIPPHASLRATSDSLSKAGLIGSPRLFQVYAKLRRADRSIRAGTYALPRDIGWNGIIKALSGGGGLVRTISLPEGFTVAQITRVIAQRLPAPAESVDAAVRDTSWLRYFDIPTRTLEGYLFPDTYTLPEGSTAREAVALMARRFDQAWRKEWTARLDTIGLSRHDLLTLASIVEKEAKLPEERPVIAGVYMNRLRAGMLLQADPTVQYALPTHVNRVMYKDLRVKSPYNTYLHKGLPPGPIASPGAPSIVAALYPAKVPYRYFVAFPDGHHEFRATEAQFDKIVGEARKAWAAYFVLHPPDTSATPTDTPAAKTKSAGRGR